MFNDNDIQEVLTFLNQKVDKMETEAEMMRFCCTLLTYVHGICDVFAEEEEEDDNDEQEVNENDTDIG